MGGADEARTDDVTVTGKKKDVEFICLRRARRKIISANLSEKFSENYSRNFHARRDFNFFTRRDFVTTTFSLE